ncbi:MAG: histidine--tRNA ligase [Desulfobacterales bacterium]|nr:histidine--tRNA ligase [Desulfobacterales bacterium]
MIQLIRGFKDILPGEVELWQEVEKTARSLFEDFGFREVRLPIMERTALFTRSIGENTDIVEKEMYTFPDRKGEMITLRPEATASVVRSYIQHKLYAVDPVQKSYTIGPMFRRERPQKGRYRQFYQINAEVFGIESPLIDAQIIFMLVTLFTRLSVTGLTANINSLGCPKCRPAYKEKLIEFLDGLSESLCSACNKRSSKNPLRVLDCKVPTCAESVKDAPSILDYLCPDCKDHFETVQDLLNKMGVEYIINKRLVRGLDYYTRTSFEIQTTALGAQNAVAGGGRYDGLINILGGPEIPGIGFAIGFDRLIDILSQNMEPRIRQPEVFIAALGDDCQKVAFEWTNALCAEGIKTEMDFSGKSLKALMKRANRLGARHVLIFGESEMKEGVAALRNMATKKQILVSLNDIVRNIIKNII